MYKPGSEGVEYFLYLTKKGLFFFEFKKCTSFL